MTLADLVTGFWGKVIGSALAAGGAGAGIAGTAAVVRTYVLDSRVVVLETANADQEARIRENHDLLLRLAGNGEYTRAAIDRLLEADGIPKPPPPVVVPSAKEGR